MKYMSSFILCGQPVEWCILIVVEPLHHEGVSLVLCVGVAHVQRDGPALVVGQAGGQAGRHHQGRDPHTQHASQVVDMRLCV